MSGLNRRAILGAFGCGAALALAGCTGTSGMSRRTVQAPLAPRPIAVALDPSHAAIYGPVEGEPFPVQAVDLSRIDPAFLRTDVEFPTDEPSGTIVIDPQARYLYFVEADGRARRYGVGVGREGFSWSGVATVNSKQEWPDWYPTPEMLERRPDIAGMIEPLRSGMGIPGGLRNPIGARGLYLWQDNVDTLYRIHGTTEPYTIGQSVSSGCIRMINQDVMDLYERTPVGTKVVVLSPRVS